VLLLAIPAVFRFVATRGRKESRTATADERR